MNLVIIILACCVGLIFIWILTGNKNYALDGNSTIATPQNVVKDNQVQAEITPEKERVSLPRQFRRIQQSLSRQRNVIIDNMKEMHHQGQVLDIASQMVRINDQQNILQDAMIDLKHKDLEITSKGIEIDLISRENLLTINEARNKLEFETIDSIRLKAENDIQGSLLNLKDKQLDLKVYEIDLNGKMIDLRDAEIDLKAHENRIDFKSQIQNIKEKEFGVIQQSAEVANDRIRNELSFKEQVNRLNEQEVELKKLGLNNIKGELVNAGTSIDLKKKEVDLTIKDGLATLKDRELENKKGSINNLIGKLDNKEKSVNLAEKNLALSYARLSENFRVLLNNILLESRSLKLDRRDNALRSKQELLDLREYRLGNLSRYIDQMYEVKSNWLRIESKDNELQYREQQLRLDNKYHQTQQDLERLRLYRYENNIVHREQKLELQNLIRSMQDNWRLY